MNQATNYPHREPHTTSQDVVTITHRCDFSDKSPEPPLIADEPTHHSPNSATKGRVPRVSRLMALAVYLEGLISNGTVANYADIARLGYVSRARLTQIMNLRLLAPDIQETLLFLPLVTAGRDPVSEQQLRPIVREFDWNNQRSLWHTLFSV